MALSPNDPNSFARPDLAIVTHTHLQLKVNFEKNILQGSVTLDIEKRGETDFLYLDVRGLILLSVINIIDGSKLDYNVSESVSYGSKLSIHLPSIITNEEPKRYKIKILYETSPNSTALQWLKPQQTAGGKHPYLFSQNQAIHARAMLPCQDTPSVKSTYSAEITAPKELVVLMSALRIGSEDLHNGTIMYKFNQPIPVQSYLIAIAVGALVSKQIGPKSSVWCEQEFIEESAYEFQKTESMLQIAEELCGPYVWGIYDLLVLPPSFPFGGMENPCVTFITPTILAGDRSLVSVVAHEISHSWTGNLVTNANFEHFWLNEGFTRFVEGKINGKLQSESYRHFTAVLGLAELKETIKTLGETNQLTNLVPNLTGIDPDDAFSSVPYEKGQALLLYLEQTLGGSEKFNPFLKSYLDKFKYKSITTKDWKDYLYEYFASQKQLLDTVNWNAWLYAPGMPPALPNYDNSMQIECTELAKKWINWSTDEPSPFNKTDVENLLPLQTVAFLKALHANDTPLPIKKLETMDETYHFGIIKNAEIRFIWLRLCIKSRWEAKVEDVFNFINKMGRMKYLRPIYRDMYNWKEMRERTLRNYEQNKEKMMYVASKMVAKDLHLDE